MSDSNIEWKKGFLIIENEPKPYDCIFCKDRVHYIDDIPEGMNKYELELSEEYDITSQRVNIKHKALDRFCGTIFTEYDKSDNISGVLVAREFFIPSSKRVFVIDSLMNIKNTMFIYSSPVKLYEAVG